MSIEEKDFIMRQSKQLAKGLAAFLKNESVEEIMSLGEKQEEKSCDIGKEQLEQKEN